jgi:hypothetical protein
MAIVQQSLADVCFASESGQTADILDCPLCADFVAEVAEEESGPWRRARSLACHAPVRAVATPLTIANVTLA